MGCLFVLKDSETKVFFKKNIFILEKFIISESLISIFLSFIALQTFPFDSIKLVKQKLLIESIIYYIFLLSLISLVFSVLIKYIHIKKNMKPNYRLCLMNFFGYIGFYIFVICFFLSIYVSLVIGDWEELIGVITYKRLSSGKKFVVSLGTAIYTLIWNIFIILITFCGLVDFLMEVSNISKASKYLSEGNNINNKNLLNELFKIPIDMNIYNNLNRTNSVNNLDINSLNKKQNFSKLRIIMSNNNNEKYFENKNNRFREVEIMQKVEYKSIGIQTEENNNGYNNYIDDKNNKLIDDDLSNNFILVKNKPLIDSKNSINDVLNAPIK